MADRVDVLAVMDAEIESLPIMAEMMAGPVGCAVDATGAVARMTAARAAVAALIASGNALMAYRIGEYPSRGDLRDNGASRAQIDALATALANIGPQA